MPSGAKTTIANLASVTGNYRAPRIVELPTLHPDQVKAVAVIRANRFTAVRCGRRWGKTDLAKTIACNDAINGKPVGWFAPEYKFISEAYNEIAATLDQVIVQSSKMEGVIRPIGGGRIDFWSLDNDRAGRSRKYARVIIDEAAFAKPNMMDIWERSIKPTLLDLNGKCLVTSNTNGISPDNFLWAICNEKNKDGTSKYRFAEYHAPSMNNPHVPQREPGETDSEYFARRTDEFEKLKRDNAPLVYKQEYLADFVDWSGDAFFSQDSLLVDRLPVTVPKNCDTVFAVIDSAVKTGKDNDGTAVIYFAYYRAARGSGYRLVILDYDVLQIEGAVLETWLPNVVDTLKALSEEHRAIRGPAGVWIEDKASGMILVQQGQKKYGPFIKAIDSKLTSVGKDERAISVSGYVYRGLVKIGEKAYGHHVNYKGSTQNHLVSQVVGFRIGDKDAFKRADDLLDCFTYGIAMGLGDAAGF
jgi:hypothetical protein